MDQEAVTVEQPRRPRLTTRDIEALMQHGLSFPSIPGLLTDDEEEAAARKELLDQFFEQAIAQHQRSVQGLLGGADPARA